MPAAEEGSTREIAADKKNYTDVLNMDISSAPNSNEPKALPKQNQKTGHGMLSEIIYVLLRHSHSNYRIHSKVSVLD